MSYGEIFSNLRKKNISNWLLYTQHEFLKKLSEGTLKKDFFFKLFKTRLPFSYSIF